MSSNIVKGLLGIGIGVLAGAAFIKMVKEGKVTLTVDDKYADDINKAIRELKYKNTKLINPNGEDFTIKPDALPNLVTMENTEE